jgi:hypothetical protein
MKTSFWVVIIFTVFPSLQSFISHVVPLGSFLPVSKFQLVVADADPNVLETF